MKFTQTYSNAQTLTTSTVSAITQSCASLRSKFAQKPSSNISCSCSCHKKYDSITSRLHEIALSTATQQTEETLFALASTNSPSFANSLLFSNSFNVHDSFAEINKILSYGMQKSRDDTAVQDHFNSSRSIHDSISTTVASPKITLDCSLVSEFFGMVERGARKAVAEEEVYSGSMVSSFFSLVESKCLESTIFADYSLHQFYKMVKLGTKLPITEPTVIESYDFISFISSVESDLRFAEPTSDFGMMAEYLAMKNNPVPEEAIYDPLVDEISQLIESIVLKVPIIEPTVIESYGFVSFISSIESDLRFTEPTSDFGMMAEYLAMKNNPVREEAILDPLVDEISELIESIVSTADDQSNFDYLPAFLALSEAKKQEDNQFDALGDYSLPQFYRLVNLETKPTKDKIYETYMVASFITMNEKTVKQAYISHQMLQKNKQNSWFARGLDPLPPHYQELSKFSPCQTRDTTTVANRLYCKIGQKSSTRLTPEVEYTSQPREPTVSDKIKQKNTARINKKIKTALSKPRDVPTSDRYIKPRNILGESTRFNQQSNVPKAKVEKYSYNRNNSIFLELDMD